MLSEDNKWQANVKPLGTFLTNFIFTISKNKICRVQIISSKLMLNLWKHFVTNVLLAFDDFLQQTTNKVFIWCPTPFAVAGSRDTRLLHPRMQKEVIRWYTPYFLKEYRIPSVFQKDIAYILQGILSAHTFCLERISYGFLRLHHCLRPPQISALFLTMLRHTSNM